MGLATWRPYLGLVSPYRKAIALIVGCSLLISLFDFSTPLFMQVIFNEFFVGRQVDIVNKVALAMVVIALANGFTNLAASYLRAYLSVRVDAKLSTLFFRHFLHLPLLFLMGSGANDVLSRFTEIEVVGELVNNNSLVEMVALLISALVSSALICLYSTRVFVIVLLAIVLLHAGMVFLTKKVIVLSRERLALEQESRKVLFEQINGLDTLQSLGGTVAARWRWETQFVRVEDARCREQKTSMLVGTAATVYEICAMLVIMLNCVYLSMAGKLSPGQVVALSIFSGNVFRNLRLVADAVIKASSIFATLGRADPLFATPAEDAGGFEVASASTACGTIELRDVTFRYRSDGGDNIVDGVSLVIKPGETVALVGPSGSGKSTLAYLLSGLHHPTTGKVLIDGVDLRELPIKDVRRRVGMVMQESMLFSGTMLENIAFGDPQPDLERAKSVAMAAEAHGFISGFSLGYLTLVQQLATGLSVGQKQRVNIARALYKQPGTLILDEATSALDALSERSIVGTLKENGEQRTTVIIAQRLNTVMHADRIFVLKEGRVVETGRHEELLAVRGLYHELFCRQLGGFSS